MIDEDIRDLLIRLIGRNAYNNNTEVSADFRKVMQALRYLILQTPIMLRNSEQEDRDYGKKILDTVREMLEDK